MGSASVPTQNALTSKSNSDEKGDMYEEDGGSNANVMLIFTGAFTISFGLIVYYTIKYRRMVRNGVMDRANNRENGLLGRGVTNEELNAMYVWEYTGGGRTILKIQTSNSAIKHALYVFLIIAKGKLAKITL